VPIAFTGRVKQLALSKEYGCALDDGGKVHCWAMKGPGAPQLVSGLDQVTRIDGGRVAVIAVRADGSAHELEHDTQGSRAKEIGKGDLVLALLGLGEAFGVTKGGKAVQWLFAGPKAGVPQPVAGLSDVTALAEAHFRVCALLASHKVHCFSRAEAPGAAELENVLAIGGYEDRMSALLEDGSFVSWTPGSSKPARSYE
jgi:hypothetical protein